jgi:hypothetical protein
MALIAGTSFASAQGVGGGGVSGGAPGGGGAGSAAQQSTPSSSSGSTSSTPMNRDRDSATESKGSEKGGLKSTQSDEKMQPPGAKNQRAQDDMKGAPKGEKSAQDNMKGEGREGRDGSKMNNAQSKDGMSKDGMSKDGVNSAQTKSPTDTKSQTTTGNAATSATAAPPAEKRTQIVSAIKSEKIEPTTNVNFNISVGATVPANVRFHPLPARIVEIYPEWRGFDVIFVNGRYIIVRPQTHEIVYIIEG